MLPRAELHTMMLEWRAAPLAGAWAAPALHRRAQKIRAQSRLPEGSKLWHPELGTNQSHAGGLPSPQGHEAPAPPGATSLSSRSPAKRCQLYVRVIILAAPGGWKTILEVIPFDPMLIQDNCFQA